jgi:hypothetical protein
LRQRLCLQLQPDGGAAARRGAVRGASGRDAGAPADGAPAVLGVALTGGECSGGDAAGRPPLGSEALGGLGQRPAGVLAGGERRNGTVARGGLSVARFCQPVAPSCHTPDAPPRRRPPTATSIAQAQASALEILCDRAYVTRCLNVKWREDKAYCYRAGNAYLPPRKCGICGRKACNAKSPTYLTYTHSIAF